jgi:GAF domain-containing protein
MTGPASQPEMEAEIARQIAGAFLTASSPVEVYRLALSRIAPILGADFASVYLRDDQDPALLRLACAHNWPQSSARFLGDIRIREGRGPTGTAVETGEAVHVQDLFGDPELQDWWEPARELGFVSLISLPLATGGKVLGAISFYFRERQDFNDSSRALLTVVAHQLATTVERARSGGDREWGANGTGPGSR